jgi:hypothetical protein
LAVHQGEVPDLAWPERHSSRTRSGSGPSRLAEDADPEYADWMLNVTYRVRVDRRQRFHEALDLAPSRMYSLLDAPYYRSTEMSFALMIPIDAAAGAHVAGCRLRSKPGHGQRQLALITEAQEIEMGRSAAEQAAQLHGPGGRPGAAAVRHRLGQALARDSERPALPWSFQVVDDPTPNAFARPAASSS